MTVDIIELARQYGRYGYRRIVALESRLATTEDIVRTARVGWRTLVTIGSIILTLAGTAGALIAKWLPFAGGFPK